jgi:hypothetical protein
MPSIWQEERYWYTQKLKNISVLQNLHAACPGHELTFFGQVYIHMQVKCIVSMQRNGYRFKVRFR